MKVLLKKNELIAPMLVSLLVRMLGALSAFILSLVIGRELGAEESGYFFLSFTIVTFAAAFSRIGFDTTLVRFVGAAGIDDSWQDIRFSLRISVLLVGVIASAVSLMIFIASDFLAVTVFAKPELRDVLRNISPGVVGLSLLTLLAMALQGLHRVAPSIFVVNISVNLLVLFAVYGLELTTAVDIGFAWGISSFVTVAFGFLFWVRYSKPSSKPLTINLKLLLASAMPLWVAVLMSQITQWFGQFMAGAYLDSEQIAQLAVAQRTAMLTSFILLALNLVVAPRFAALYKQNEMKQLQKLALTLVKLMVISAVPIVSIMMIFSNQIMGLFGDGFSSGGHLLQILALGQLINVVTGSVGFLLSMSGHEKDLRNTVMISGPTAVILGVFLVPVFGATGSAVATALAVAIQNLVAVYWVKKRLGFNTLAVWKN